MEPATPRFSRGRHVLSTEADPSQEFAEAVALILGCPIEHVDADGSPVEIRAATPRRDDGAIAYLLVTQKYSSCDSALDRYDFHIRDGAGNEVRSPIESYNTAFGCDVHYLDWIADAAVLIYREKHDCYVAACVPGGEARYVKIAHSWVLKDGVLAFQPYRQPLVRRLVLPSLVELEALTEEDADILGMLPPPTSW